MSAKKAIPLFIALSIIALLIYKVGVQNLWLQFSKLSLEAILYLVLISILLLYVSSLKWKMFLEVFGEKVSTLNLFSLYLMGYFVNQLVPSYVGGDAMRSWYIGKKVGQHEAFAATILERYTGMVAMISMAFIFMWFVPSVTWQITVIVFLMTLGLMAGTLLILSPKFLSLLRRIKIPPKILGHVGKVQQGLYFAKNHRLLFAKALLLSYLYHSTAVINTMAAAYAIGWWNVPFWDLFVVLPIILLISSIPLTPNGLGLQEGAFYYFLKGVGATSSEAIAVALLLRAKSYVLGMFGGIVWLIRSQKDKRLAQALREVN